MFNDGANVAKFGAEEQAFEVDAVGCSERARVANVGFEGFGVHQIRLYLFVNSSAELTQNVESAIIQI